MSATHAAVTSDVPRKLVRESALSNEPDLIAELAGWPGIAGLKTSLGQFVGTRDDTSVLLAGRSRSLMKLAARCLFRHCRNVLTTDLSWPAYQKMVEDEARHTGKRVTHVAVRQRLFHRQISLDQIATELVAAAHRYRCDGLFLPAVDNLGIRLPVAEIVAAIRKRTKLHFVAIDAAQTIGHVPLSSDIECSDLVIAGTHKWFGGYLPLGLAFLNNDQSQPQIVATCRLMQASGELDDPLLDFLADLESGSLRNHTETINLTPLVTCCGALQDFACSARRVEESLQYQLANAELVRSIAESTGWRPMLAATDQRTGIVLLQSDHSHIQSLPAESLRRSLQLAGIAATAYENGVIRLSMPRCPLSESDQDQIRDALKFAQASFPHGFASKFASFESLTMPVVCGVG